MKILISDALEQSAIEVLTREGFEVDNRPGIPSAELLKVIDRYEGLVVRSATKVTAEVITHGTKLKVIGRAGTGVDNIDVDAATRRGILVMNTPGGNTISAAEHTVSMLLALARNIPQAHQSLSQGKWERKQFTGTEVFQKTVGIIGLGKIGREVALRCQGLSMQTIGYDPVLGTDVAARMNIESVDLPDLFRRSDFITVHTPFTNETKNLLSDATFGICKRGVRVINCARGGIVDEEALLRALESGQVAGAALDVFSTEPPEQTPLLSHPKVIVTPHLGASTEEAQEKVAIQIAEQIADGLHDRGFAGLVNGSALQLSMKEELKPFLQLSEKLGSLVAQRMKGKLRKLTVAVRGELLTSSIELMKAGVLKGVLSHAQSDPVNIINSLLLANELGIAVGEQREGDGGNFTHLLRVECTTDQETTRVAGTVFGQSAVRLVEIDGFRFEVQPEGFLLIYYNIDRPGMLAKVGSILAAHNVNIAGVSLGRSAAGERALTIMNVDSDIPAKGKKELAALEGVNHMRLVRL